MRLPGWSSLLETTTDRNSLWKHLEKLNDIAFAVGNGNRAFGLPGYEASVDYIWSQISNVTGTKAWKQDFPAWFGQVISVSLKIDEKDYYVYGLTYSPSTPEEGVEAELELVTNVRGPLPNKSLLYSLHEGRY